MVDDCGCIIAYFRCNNAFGALAVKLVWQVAWRYPDRIRASKGFYTHYLRDYREYRADDNHQYI